MTKEQLERLLLVGVGACVGAMLTLGAKHGLSFPDGWHGWAVFSLLVMVGIINIFAAVRGQRQR